MTSQQSTSYPLSNLPYTAEYGEISVNGWPRSERTVLETRAAKGREYILSHHTAGYEIAGSCARLAREYWAVRFRLDGAIHGRRFSNETDARDVFARIGA
jgi:hypothetical protein